MQNLLAFVKANRIEVSIRYDHMTDVYEITGIRQDPNMLTLNKSKLTVTTDLIRNGNALNDVMQQVYDNIHWCLRRREIENKRLKEE